MATSVMNGGTGDETFKQNERDGEYNGNIFKWAMNTKTKNDTFLFHSVEPGQKGKRFVSSPKTPRRSGGMAKQILQRHPSDKWS